MTKATMQENIAALEQGMVPVEIVPIRQVSSEIAVVGTSPLIVHAWSKKAKREMLDKQMHKTEKVKEPKDPEADYESSLYKFADGSGYGFPATGFKMAIVGGCRLFKGLNMTQVKQLFFVETDGVTVDDMPLVRLSGVPEPREDMVRVGNLQADIRYRAMFREWSAVLRITHLASLLPLEQLVTLVNAGGMGGIGEWRPFGKKGTGDFGRFQVAEIKG